MKTYTY